MAKGRKPKFKKLILSIIAKASESLCYKNMAFPAYEHIRKILTDDNNCCKSNHTTLQPFL